jgi:cysteine synthase
MANISGQQHRRPAMKAQSVLETIGNTPHIRLSRLFPDAEVWIKSERTNPGGSIKDRIALAMIKAAEADGSLKPGATIIEPTSGNTGIGLALVAAVKGYKLILVMPESMSVERRRLMQAYGATFDLTPKEGGMKGAIARAAELVAQTPGAWMPGQFDNPANIDIHVRTTAEEILKDFPEGLDVMITGVGTGGHLTGCAEMLKKHWPDFKVYAVEPAAPPPPKACSSASPPAPPWPPSPNKYPACPPTAASSASTTTPANATCRFRTFCRLEGKQGQGALPPGPPPGPRPGAQTF